MRLQKVEGSLRSAGVTALPCDKPTRAKFKELAGDMPVSHYLREIAFGRIAPPINKSPQLTFQGQERAVSQNTIVSVKADTRSLLRAVLLLLGLESQKDKSSRYAQLIKDVISEAEFVGIAPPWAEIIEARRELERGSSAEVQSEFKEA